MSFLTHTITYYYIDILLHSILLHTITYYHILCDKIFIMKKWMKSKFYEILYFFMGKKITYYVLVYNSLKNDVIVCNSMWLEKL